MSAEEMLKQTANDFSLRVQDAASGFTAAIQSFVTEVGTAMSAFAREQREALQRQEELQSQTSGLVETARTYSQQAVAAAGQAESSHQLATGLIKDLESQRQGLDVLIEDLRARIGALAVVVAPLPAVTPVATTAPVATDAPQATPAPSPASQNMIGIAVRDASSTGAPSTTARVPPPEKWTPGWLNPATDTWGPGRAGA
jgi:hypothetical protein